MRRSVLARIHNPRGHTCPCDPDCWCNRTALGRALKWWFPGRLFGLEHKGPWNTPLRKNEHDVPATVTRIVASDPIFAVANMPRAVEHYTRLGFEISYHNESYAFAHRQGLNLHLDLTTTPPPGGGLLYLHVDDADRLAAQWRAAGAEVTEPHNFPWGKHEGSHTDPDGNTIRFGSPRRR